MSATAVNHAEVLVAIAAGAAIAAMYFSYHYGVCGYIKRKRLARKLTPVGGVKALYIYPVKACRGISVTEAECTNLGLKSGLMRDRVFMIVQSDGRFLTSRQEPSLLLVVPSFHGNEIWLDAPNMSTLKMNLNTLREQAMKKTCRVWGQNVAGVSCGPEASEWFNTYLGKTDLELVYHAEDLKPKLCSEREKYKPLVTSYDGAAYADFTGYMMMSQPSVDDLCQRMSKSLDMRRFRPNIVVQGSDPYGEDIWKYICIGHDVWFRNVKPCQRCLMVETDPDTAIRHKDEEVLKFLKSYRQTDDPELKPFVGESCLLGVNLGIDTPGKQIKVGDSIRVINKCS